MVPSASVKARLLVYASALSVITPVDPIAETCEPLGGSEYEPSAGVSGFGGEHIGVGHPGVVIDHGMAELVADFLFGPSILHSD
jgi:hypothetical protein